MNNIISYNQLVSIANKKMSTLTTGIYKTEEIWSITMKDPQSK